MKCLYLIDTVKEKLTSALVVKSATKEKKPFCIILVLMSIQK